MSTSSLPGWLQVTLVLLCGVVGWLLLRPYQRMAQLTGRASGSEIITTRTKVSVEHEYDDARRTRGAVEQALRQRGAVVAEGRGDPAPLAISSGRIEQAGEGPQRSEGWRTPEIAQTNSGYAIYRPSSGNSVPQQPSGASQASSAKRAETRAELR